MRLRENELPHGLGEPRLADAWLGAEQHHAALTRFGAGPPAHEQLKLLFATHKGCRARAQSFEAAGNIALAQHLPSPLARGEAFQCLDAEIAKLEQATDLAARPFVDDDGVG